jgi:hypothetical protein
MYNTEDLYIYVVYAKPKHRGGDDNLTWVVIAKNEKQLWKLIRKDKNDPNGISKVYNRLMIGEKILAPKSESPRVLWGHQLQLIES